MEQKMNLSNPIRSVIPSVQGDVLGVLGRTSRPLSGRGIAELLDGRASVTGVSLVLRNLCAEGLVIGERYPPVILYRLNTEHLAADSIIALANFRQTLIEKMREQVEAWALSCEGAWIFGSFARGEATCDSDIDVLLVRPNGANYEEEFEDAWDEQWMEFSRKVSAWTGNDCQVIMFSQEEFIQLLESGEQLGKDLRRDGIALTKKRIPSSVALTKWMKALS
jgi:predicted nucleotidyltransferase